MTLATHLGGSVSYFSFESMQEGEGEHIPNLVVAHSTYDKCEDLMHVTYLHQHVCPVAYDVLSATG